MHQGPYLGACGPIISSLMMIYDAVFHMSGRDVRQKNTSSALAFYGRCEEDSVKVEIPCLDARAQVKLREKSKRKQSFQGRSKSDDVVAKKTSGYVPPRHAERASSGE